MAKSGKSSAKTVSVTVKSTRSKAVSKTVSRKSTNSSSKSAKKNDSLGVNKTSKNIKKRKQDKQLDGNAMQMFQGLQKKIEQMEKKIIIAERKEKSLTKSKGVTSIQSRGSKRKSPSNTENPDSRDNLNKSLIKSTKKLKTTKTDLKKSPEVKVTPRSRERVVRGSRSIRGEVNNVGRTRRRLATSGSFDGHPDVDEERHGCTIKCPPSCQGHLRPNEIIIYESSHFNLQLLSGQMKVNTSRPTAGARRKPQPAVGSLPPTPARVQLLLDQPAVDFATAETHSWNSNDRSFNIRLMEDDPLAMRRRPVAQSTDCVRAKVGYTSGLHLLSISWPHKMRGTHAVVGVATREQPLHAVGYQSLIGSTEHSWGWDLGRLKAYHNSKQVDGVRYPVNSKVGDQIADLFYMVIDMDAGTLSFYADNKYLGVAHTGLRGHKVFPCISTVWGNCEVRMTYIGGLESGSPLSLQELASGEV